MLKPAHDIHAVRGTSPRRAAIIGAVGALHVAAIYALISGMAGDVLKQVPPDLIVHLFQPSHPANTVTPPQQPSLVRPTIETPQVQPPEIKIDDSSGQSIRAAYSQPHTAATPDSAAAGVANTHTIPPYPLAASTLGHQGTVVLRLTVSPLGDVVAASVVQSSGFPELDSQAVAWVTEHWKYRPAIQGGAPVTSQTEAAVRFDLKQAHG